MQKMMTEEMLQRWIAQYGSRLTSGTLPTTGSEEKSSTPENATEQNGPTSLQRTEKTHDKKPCPKCNGNGWVVLDRPPGHPEFGKAIPCECMADEIALRRAAKLERQDGLNEAQRTFSLNDAKKSISQRTAASALKEMVDARKGQVVLYGDYGLGKSFTMIAAVNYAKENGVPAHYTTLSDLLNYLRDAFNPESTDNLDSRWDLLVGVPVLAIDEIDKTKSTAWAMERFTALVDKRWANMHGQLTIYGMNADLKSLDAAGLGHITDRLEDTRGTIVNFTGKSMRR